MSRLLIGQSPPVPVAPPQAVAAGYTKCLFYSYFNNRAEIDFANTKDPSYKWFVNNAWTAKANGVDNAPTNVWQNAPATLESDLVMLPGGGIKILTDHTGMASALQTAVQTGPNFGDYNGKLFRNGWYIEVDHSFDPAFAMPSGALGGWPAWWLAPYRYSAGLIDPSEFYVEPDGFEAPGSGPGTFSIIMAINDWKASTNLSGSSHNSNADVSSDPLIAGLDWRQRQRTAMLYLPLTQTEFATPGVGYFLRFVNDQRINANTVSFQAAAPAVPMNGANRDGCLSEIDGSDYFLIVGTGPDWPHKIYRVAVFGPP